MKKNILVFVFIIAVSSVFALEFSAGASLGSEITQSYKESFDYPYPVVVARPSLGFIADFGFDNFGIQAGFDHSFTKSNTTYHDEEAEISDYIFEKNFSSSNLYLKPYFSWKGNIFSYSAGPVIGFSFYNYKSRIKTKSAIADYEKESEIEVVWGGEIDLMHEVNHNLSVYLALPLLVNTGELSYKDSIYDVDQVTSEETYFGLAKNLYFIPKMGIKYKF